MTALSEKVAAEHAYQAGTVSCSCGELFEITTDPAVDRRDHAIHLADVTERAVRDTIVAELADAQSHVFYPTVGNPDSLTGKLYMNGVGAGIEFATLLAREGTTP